MVAFGHTAIGSIIGLYTYQQFATTDPTTGLLVSSIAGIASHYLFDTIPHGHFFRESEYKKKVIYAIIFDLFLSVILYILTAFYFSDQNLLFTLFILFGIGGSQLPDILDGLILTGFLPDKGLIKMEHKFHNSIHWHGKKEKTLLWSKWDIWQVTIFFFGLYLLLTFRS